jgi:succinyl-diaminopimelate desuccinylase
MTETMSAMIRRWAEEDNSGVVSLIQQLVRIPSRGGVDPYPPVLDAMLTWFANQGVAARTLEAKATGQTVGVVCDVPGVHPGPHYVLDACVDTAPFGDPAAWSHPPTSGVIAGGWLYGRGAADSKAAVAIFAHIAARLQHQTDRLHGTLTVLLDADEHTGAFGGARTYFGGDDAPRDVAGVLIGYPGCDQLVIGGRGFLRARMTVRGRAGHTGSSGSDGYENAAEKSAYLVGALARHRAPAPVDPDIHLPPKLTITGIRGGESYSVVPDRCTVDVDVRLTPSFAQAAAASLIRNVVAEIDERYPSGRMTEIEFEESWPAYQLAESAPIRVALLRAAENQLAVPLEVKVAGPSNIGNYLASLGIDATAGLGVRYEGLHGSDERIDLSTVPMIQATYQEAILTLLTRIGGPRVAGCRGR